MPILGLIFLRHAYNRFLMVKKEVEANLPSRGGVIRPINKEDFTRKMEGKSFYPTLTKEWACLWNSLQKIPCCK